MQGGHTEDLLRGVYAALEEHDPAIAFSSKPPGEHVAELVREVRELRSAIEAAKAVGIYLERSAP